MERVPLRTHTDLVRLPRIDGVADGVFPPLSAKCLGQVSVQMRRVDGIARELSEDLVDVHGTRQLIHAPKRRNTRATRHQRRTRLLLTEQIRTARIHRRTMIGAEHNDVLIVLIMRRKIVKEVSELPIHCSNLTAVDVLTQRIWL